MTQNLCKNCGNQFEGKYCNACGEKVYSDHDKSMGHFMHETMHFFTHLDSKFFKTLVLIFRRPAVLSETFCSGVRNKYFKPFSLFFIGVILYLLFPIFPGLNMTFQSNLINLKAQHMGPLADLAYHKAAARQISIEAFAEKYDHKSPAFAKVLLLVILPLSALALKAIFARRKKYFFDYLVLATEASCIMLYLNFFILPILLYIPALIFEHFHIGSVKLLSDIVTLPAYAVYAVFWNTVAFKKFYQISFLHALLKGFLFLFLQSVVIFIIYRVILFLTVLLFI